jgi:protein tyrosine/serine phosphatase
MIPGQLDWPECVNVRDLGGLPVAGGGRTRGRALVRADSLQHLTPEGLAAARAYGVTRVVDLRGEPEAAKFPTPYAADPAYRLRPLVNPLAERHRDQGAETTLAAVYRASLTRNAANIVAGLAAIADAPPGPVVVHCAAGKDRTGMIVALALRAAGVGDDAIAADYAHTESCLVGRTAAWLAATPEPDRERAAHWLRADPETIREMLDELDSGYGGVEAYLDRHGMPAAQVAALRERLVATSR